MAKLYKFIPVYFSFIFHWPCLFLKGGKAVLVLTIYAPVKLCSSQQYNRRIPEYIPGTDEANS